MQKSLKEIIKQIAALEQQKEEIMSDESQNSITRYGTNEEIPTSDYNFSAVRNEIERLDSTIRYLRHRLHHSNATVLVPEFEITIGECIIMMAQLGKEKATLTRMARRGKMNDVYPTTVMQLNGSRLITTKTSAAGN